MDRRSVRLKGYDYLAPGAYFVTIVTQGRAALFGAVVNEEMRLSPTGSIADACWREIPLHFHHVDLGSFIVMPNHVHGILILHAATDGADALASAPRRGTIYRAPTQGFGAPRVGSIPTTVRTYEAAVTRAVGRAMAHPRRLWQRNYYEHILRDEADCPCASWRKDVRRSAAPPSHEDLARRYIEVNPMTWEEDDENPSHPRQV